MTVAGCWSGGGNAEGRPERGVAQTGQRASVLASDHSRDVMQDLVASFPIRINIRPAAD
jgi:hypothetical protein